MPIKRIVVEIEAATANNPDNPKQGRVLIFDGSTKQWTGENAGSQAGGMFPSEVKLATAIDAVRQNNPV
jgi:hypothetical protein